MELRAVLRNPNRAFDVALSTKGARYKVKWDSGKASTEPRPSSSVSDNLQPIPRVVQHI
jgi:hypothetical protein